MSGLFRSLVVLGLLMAWSAPSQAAKKTLAPLPPAAHAIGQNFYAYGRSWRRLQRWVRRNYGRKSRVEPLAYHSGVALLTVVALEARFKWSYIHFFKVGKMVRISIVPRPDNES
jgi:hypothetical protein